MTTSAIITAIIAIQLIIAKIHLSIWLPQHSFRKRATLALYSPIHTQQIINNKSSSTKHRVI
jgi:hypothetical protein